MTYRITLAETGFHINLLVALDESGDQVVLLHQMCICQTNQFIFVLEIFSLVKQKRCLQ